jgi:hypothetical protein
MIFDCSENEKMTIVVWLIVFFFSVSIDWTNFTCDDRSRNNDSRDFDRDFVCHE